MERAAHELQLAGFRLSDNLFAIDIMRIKEIVTPQKLTGFPLQSEALSGMINLRGQVIPVMDLRARFSMPPRSEGPGKLIIVSISGQLVALAVDDLDDVITVSSQELTPPPAMVEGVGAEFLLAVCLHDRQIYLLLDIDYLFISAEIRSAGLLER